MALTPSQAAERLGISRQAVHKAIKDKRLKAKIIAPGWYLIEERALETYEPKDYPRNATARPSQR
jgi:excisionase family DNA binding protein